MRIKNARPEAVFVPAIDQVVDAGAEIEVDDELGSSLLEQPDNWKSVKPKPTEAKE